MAPVTQRWVPGWTEGSPKARGRVMKTTSPDQAGAHRRGRGGKTPCEAARPHQPSPRHCTPTHRHLPFSQEEGAEQGSPREAEAWGAAPPAPPAVTSLGGGAGRKPERPRLLPSDGEQEEEEGSEAHPCFLGQRRRDRRRVWPLHPRGAGDSLYLAAVPSSPQPRFCRRGSKADIPAAGTTTQAGRVMLSAFIQLMQQSIQGEKKKIIMKP